jgi:hypothetical protein
MLSMWWSPNFVGAAGAEDNGKDNMDLSLMSFLAWLTDWLGKFLALLCTLIPLEVGQMDRWRFWFSLFGHQSSHKWHVQEKEHGPARRNNIQQKKEKRSKPAIITVTELQQWESTHSSLQRC